MRRLLGITMVSLVATAAILGGASPAFADDNAPEMVSFARTSPAILGGGDLVAIRFTARDAGGGNIRDVEFQFEGPRGALLWATLNFVDRESVATEVSNTLSRWAASGSYRLAQVLVSDYAGNFSIYHRDGSVEVQPAGATPPPAPSLDFAGADFGVENPGEDVTAPVLTSARLFQDPVPAGDPAVVEYTASDEGSGIAGVNIQYMSPTQQIFDVSAPSGYAAAGPASRTVPLAAVGGLYAVGSISVEDGAGNVAYYESDGSVFTYPRDLDQPPAPPFGVHDIDFTVTAKSGDRTVPTLSSVERRSSAPLHPGEILSFDYRAADAGTGVVDVDAYWMDDRGHELEVRKSCGDSSAGPAGARIPSYISTGTWRLSRIIVWDGLANNAEYGRDGTVLHSPEGAAGPTAHSFDFSALDVRIVSGHAREDDGRDTTNRGCPSEADVSLGGSTPAVAPGAPVTLSGAVTHARVAVRAPVVALYAIAGSKPSLLAVQRGSTRGRYSRTIRPAEGAVYRARFLGSEGANGADPAASKSVTVAVAPRLRASLDRSGVAPGSVARISGTVTPGRAGQRVVLERLSGRRWVKAGGARLGSGGRFAMVVRPSARGTIVYRVRRPANRYQLAAASRRLTLRVA